MEEDKILMPSTVISAHEIYVIDNLLDLGLIQVNHVSNVFGKFLDLAFISSEILSNVYEVEIPLAKSDLHHRAFELNISDYTFARPVNDGNYELDYLRSNFIDINANLSIVNWDNTLSNINLADAYSKFLDTVRSSLHNLVPLKQRVSHTHPKWFTKGLLRLKNAKTKAHKLYKKSKDIKHLKKFKQLRKEFEVLHRFLYRKYLTSIEGNIKSDSKCFWSFLKNKKYSSGIPSHMEYNNVKSNDLHQTCDLFAQYFESVYCTNNSILESFTDDTNSIFDLGHLTIEEDDIEAAIRKLDSNPKQDADGVSHLLVKNCMNSLIYPLKIIFNLSLKSGTFLDRWKFSYITPIFKAGVRHRAENYRGVSVMNTFPKLLDLIISSKLNFLINGIITPEQHGFSNGKSIVTNLAIFTNFISSSMEGRNQVDTIYTDFCKAFDRVNIARMIKKLKDLGFHSSLLKWMESYLTNRKQMVRIGTIYSRIIYAQSGVPQGSHLGPSLFLLYINDIVLNFKFCKCLIFADDVKIFSVINSISDAELLQRDIDELSNWCTINGFSLNIAKCNVLSFYRVQNPVVYDYKINNTSVKRVSEIKDLGVIFDTKLSFSSHIEYIVCKSFSILGFIKRNSQDFRDPFTIKTLYVSLVRSVLEFASVIWYPFYDIYIKRIESVQKSLTRYIIRKLNLWHVDLPNYDTRCKLLGLSKLHFRRSVHCAIFARDILMYKIKSPELLSLINLYAPERPIRSRDLLYVPPRRTNYGRREPITNAIVQFNEFSDFTDITMDRNLFKSTLLSLEYIK